MPRSLGRLLLEADIEVAAQLLGACDEILRRTGARLDPYDEPGHTNLHVAVAREIGKRAVGLIECGAELDVQSAVALAQSSLPPS
jgi:hypothetical protein